MKKHGIAIVGCGTVGGASSVLLSKEIDHITKRSGIDIFLKYIIDRDFTRAKELGLEESLFLEDLETALKDPDIETMVELVGGTTFALELSKKILNAGKNLVTANKALFAYHGPELFALARKNGVAIGIEASCGGGIPIIRALYDGLMANKINALYGIVNGTCNYILTEMIQKGLSYDVALEGAQAEGLAEADPTLDVTGYDSAHKIAIMASLAFGSGIDFEKISVEGIDKLKLIDVNYGQELGYVVKLIAMAEKQNGGVVPCIRPVFISKEHPLAWVSGSFNAVSVYGHAVGHTMYYGRGAGGSPTASAIVSDIISIASGISKAAFENQKIWPDDSEPLKQLSTDEINTRYYLRVMLSDKPGELAKLAKILGDHSISISSVLQKEAHKESIPVVITTNTAKEGNMKNALKEIDALSSVTEKTTCISILEEPEEFV